MNGPRMRMREEDGATLLTVIGLTTVLTLLASIALSYVAASTPNARRHQDWTGAIAAAEAGLDDYLARLNRNPAYYSLASPSNPYGDDALSGWAELPASDASYHYDVDASTVAATGIVTVTATGRVRDVTRTIEATFRPKGFLDFIYFSDYELVDPGMQSYTGGADCVRYHYAVPPRSDADCDPPIRWVSGDVIRGPLHSNDAILIDGDPQFLGPVTTTYQGLDPGAADNQMWRDEFNGGTYISDPMFAEDIAYGEKQSMPPTNAEVAAQTTSATGGCMYYGPTYIHVRGTQMRVSSQHSEDPPPGDTQTNPHCRAGTDVTDTGWIDRPANGVIYVANATNQDTSPCNGTTHPLGLPNGGDVSEYKCDVGDVFIWGELDGQLTVAAENNITVVADLVYAEGYELGDDLLGLIADNYVQVWHPIDSEGNNEPHTGAGVGPYIGTERPIATGDGTWQSPTIHAAILSLNHSFRVQNHADGAPFDVGDLSVRGAIAQKFRGPVGTSSGGSKASGYDKDYVYDYRLRYLTPPYFIEPVEAQWRQRTWAELQAPDDLPPVD